MLGEKPNYTTFSTEDPSGLPYNAPCKECTEDLKARTEYTRTFTGNGSKSGLVYSQAGYSPIHVKNEAGQWISLDARLKPTGNGTFAAKDQNFPTAMDLSKGSSIRNVYGEISYNRPELLWKSNDGTLQSLGQAQFSSYTAGDNGIYITNVWPGIDMEIRYMLGAIKTNYILNSRPQQSEGQYIIRDAFRLTNGLRLKLSGNDVIIETPAGNEAFTISACIGYDNDPNRTKGAQSFSYALEGSTLDMVVPISVLQDPAMVYPYTVDPLVSSSNTLPTASITGSGYSSTCTTNSCDYNMTVPTPANSTITDVQFSFAYIATGSCYLYDGSLRLASGSCMTGFYNCPDFGPGTCTGTNVPIFSQLSSCMPAPSCAPQNVPFQLQFYRCYNAGGCSNSCIGALAPWTMTLIGRTDEIPSVSANGAASTTICEGSSANLVVTGAFGVPPYTYTWSPGALSGASVSVSPTTSTTYTVTLTDACSQVVSSSVTVNVTPPLAAPNITSNSPICAGQSINLTAPAGGGTYHWTGPNGFTSTVQNPTIPSASTANAGSYSLYIVQSGCTSLTSTHNVVISSAPAAPTISSNSPICAGGTLQLSTTSANVDYFWTGPNGYTSSAQNPSVVDITPTQAGSYNLYTSSAGCTSNTATLVVQIGDSPSVTYTGPSLVCGKDVQLSASANVTAPATIVSYDWYAPAPIGNGPTFQHTFSQTVPNNINVFVVVTSSNGCKDTTNFPIQLADTPLAAFDAIDLCDQESAKLNEQHTWGGTSTSSPSFAWVYNGTNISWDANPTYNFGGPGTYSVTLTVTNPLFSVCSSSVTKQVRILPLPTLDFTFESECVKDVKFNGTAAPDSLIANYSWNFENSGSDTGASVSHVFLQSGLYNVVFTATTVEGCAVSVTKPVQIDNKSSEIPEIPNIVTANGDNTNDMIDLNTMLGDCGNYEFALFSRWGNVVYSQKNGGTPFVGKNNQGTWLTPGVYFYVLKFNKEHKSGSITVIR